MPYEIHGLSNNQVNRSLREKRFFDRLSLGSPPYSFNLGCRHFNLKALVRVYVVHAGDDLGLSRSQN